MSDDQRRDMSDDIEFDFGEPELPDDDGFIDDENEDFEPDDEIIRAKWTMDKAETLSEAAAMLRGFADHLVGLESEGWQLTRPVEDDYGFIKRADVAEPNGEEGR
jgi:hypothetical protein